MNRYSKEALIKYTSYLRRIDKGIKYHYAIKIGEKKWRVMPNGAYEGSNPKGWIVTATKFPPSTEDFGKVCVPPAERVQAREIKCTCPDATAIEEGRKWVGTNAGLFYPCKHIIAVLVLEKIDFLKPTIDNYKKSVKDNCGIVFDPPSPPGTTGNIFIWVESHAMRIFPSPYFYFAQPTIPRINDLVNSFGARTMIISNIVPNIYNGIEFDYLYTSGGASYKTGSNNPPSIESYSIGGTGQGEPGYYANLRKLTGDVAKYAGISEILLGRQGTGRFDYWKRSEFEGELNKRYPNPQHQIEINGDNATITRQDQIAVYSPNSPSELNWLRAISDPYTITVKAKFIPIPELN